MWTFGGAGPDGSVHGELGRFVPRLMRWAAPLPPPSELKWVAGRSGKAGPTPFKELRPPTLQALHHTATVCGEEVYVIGCAPTGGGLSLSILHTPSLSWSEPPNAEALLAFSPRVRSGHSAVLLPASGGIVVLGGVRTDTGPARPSAATASSPRPAASAELVHIADPAAACRDIGARPKSSAAAAARRRLHPPASTISNAPWDPSQEPEQGATSVVGRGAAGSLSNELNVLVLPRAQKNTNKHAPDYKPVTKISWAQHGSSKDMSEAGLIGEGFGVWPAPMSGHTATALLLKFGKMAGNLSAGGGGGGRCRCISRASSGGTVSDTEAMVVLGGFTGAGGRAIAEANGETPDARSQFNAQMYLLRPSDSRWYALAHAGVAPTQRALHCASLVGGNDSSGTAEGMTWRICLFGGWGLPPTGPATTQAAARPEYLHDVHILQLDLAQQASDPSGSPGRRNAASGVFQVQAGGGALWAGRAWGAQWSSPALNGPPPAPRAGACSVPTRAGGVLVLGGYDDDGAMGDGRLSLVELPAAACGGGGGGGGGSGVGTAAAWGAAEWGAADQTGEVPRAGRAVSAVSVGPFVYALISPTEIKDQGRTELGLGALYVLDVERSLRPERLGGAFTPRRVREAVLPPPQTLKLSCPPAELPAAPSSYFARPTTPAAAAGGGLAIFGMQAEGRHCAYTTAERVPFTVQAGGTVRGGP